MKNKDLERLQGSWEIVSLEVEGASMGENAFRGSRIVVSGNRFTSVSMGATYQGTMKIDPTKKPIALDLLFEEGPEKGNRSLAIYALDGDTWRICLTLSGKTRPTAFATKAGSRLALETLKRSSGPSRQESIRAEIARLEGEWSMVSCERDGQTLPREFVKTGSRTAKGNETTVILGGQTLLKAAFSVDPTTAPKTIDYILTAGANVGETQAGIYVLEGDTVTFCFAAPGDPRPTEFTTRGRGSGTLVVWKRKK